tara:strand:+ start:212 stop:613 length:402 start_codon:yes stop_codon:yes gene_type:complete
MYDRRARIRVFCREMPLDLFTGMATTEEWLEQMERDWRLQGGEGPLMNCREYKHVRALQASLDRVRSPEDREQRDEWVISLPIQGDPFAQPVAVVRKYDNNGNTYLATRSLELGFIMGREILPLGFQSYDRWR